MKLLIFVFLVTVKIRDADYTKTLKLFHYIESLYTDVTEFYLPYLYRIGADQKTLQ